ncbi:MAG TPA: diaminopimelate decarboxylase [Firmicutes bacterium]|nr:diaminopimelate decarboxylase [Bacillota bacterium]
MNRKKIPLSKAELEKITGEYSTPFHLYDEKAIRDNVRSFYRAFSWAEGFKNYFAVKACPNPTILKILKDEGMGVDCSSLTELILAEKVGFRGEEIMFTSNDTPDEEFKKAASLGAVINLDDIRHIDVLERSAGIPELVSFRYNPGDTRTGNVLIGLPQEAKYGVTRDQIIEAFRMIKDKGAKRFALHTMVASNELDENYFVETARMLFELAVKIKDEVDIRIETVNMGGGLGIPYRPEERAINLVNLAAEIHVLYDDIIVPASLDPVKVVFECGRLITGPYGYLVSRVRHVTSKYKEYVGLDASMANLMRPGIYGAYHHITVPGKEDEPHDRLYDVTGSLCENADKFAIDRYLPQIEPGDLIVIHDTGAHGYSMGYNYNGKLRSAELLLRENGDVQLVRRAETIDDYFATMRFNGAPVII